jgi:hypothetical protein
MSFTAEQIKQLLEPINPSRVLRDNKGMSHVSQQDVTAHLSRIFGFQGWDKTILDLRCVRDGVGLNSSQKEVPAVTYICTLRLTVRCPDGCCAIVKEDVGTGTSPNLPSYGDAHDFAAKNAVSYALKRCAKDLGDQFGLSLYNKGQMSALVKGTLVMPGAPAPTGDVQDGIEQQVSDGEHVAADTAPSPAPTPDSGTPTPRQALWAYARGERGWNQQKLGEEFATWSHGVVLDPAVPDDQVQAFLIDLRSEAQAA